MPVAVFAIGPQSLEPGEVDESRGHLDQALAKLAGLALVSAAVFGSVVDPARLRFPYNRIAASDARDWDAIRQWASEVADAFCASPRAVPVTERQTR